MTEQADDKGNYLQKITECLTTQEMVNMYLGFSEPKNPHLSVFCWLVSYGILPLNSAAAVMVKVTSVNEKYTKELAQLSNFNFSNTFDRTQEENFQNFLSSIKSNWHTILNSDGLNVESLVKSAQTVIPFICKCRGVEYSDGLVSTYVRIYEVLFQVFKISEFTVHVEALSYFLILEMYKTIHNLFNSSDDNSYVSKITKLGQELEISTFDSPEKISKFTHSLVFDSISKLNLQEFFEFWDRFVFRKGIIEIYLYELIKTFVSDNKNGNYLQDFVSQNVGLNARQFNERIEASLYIQLRKDSRSSQNLVFASMAIAGLFILYRKFMSN
ncbi:hypothetical protein TVAG_178320 [Trichomonas vaginalis G3]|uniref:Uncharacterized protein n=1 Tax=Trichomonas vaginalis (strain ATCC PRA-98 / G3) TaxID=412133 RepID=A2DII4_TRIV3|nr:hypothetical protein TVAGG3_0602290 [Trichomonas vaginalis G3]EAY19788.1 hypothetical protein TVAG_178320 [Trichomonas vaginalis G3]KAI5523992.1 hypothetical protein TVAGG3_0602290 [Trichomonas vaginalis G3]|eukprot:XP_001580774.1 hypothetical protein [Trichomonas vaginalis G3]